MAYKSLDQIYEQQCRNKPVTPLQRHTILGEKYNITITDEDTVALNQEINQDTYVRIKRELKRSTAHKGMVIDGKPVSVDNVLDKVLRESGWAKKQSLAQYKQSFLNPVTRIFDSVDINEQAFIEWFHSMQDASCKFSTWLFSGAERAAADVHNFVSPQFVKLFHNSSDAASVFNQLYNLTATIGDVAVGKGEVALTLISNAVKGDPGDLRIYLSGSTKGLLDGDSEDAGSRGKFKEIEIKGMGARVDGDGFALHHSANVIDSILPSELSLSQVQIDIVKTKLDTILRKIRSDYAVERSTLLATINSLQRATGKQNAIKLEKTVKKQEKVFFKYTVLNREMDNLNKLSDIPAILSFVERLEQLTDQDGDAIFLKAALTSMNSAINNARKTSSRGKLTFADAASLLFSSIGRLLTYKSSTSKFNGYEALIDGIAGLRSYSGVDVDSLKDGIRKIFTLENASSFAENDKSRSVNINNRRLVAAIHLACYLEVKKFDYIMFTNDYIGKSIAYEAPLDKKLGDKLIDVYSFFKANSLFHFSSLSDKTGRSKSVAITYGPVPKKESDDTQE